MTLLDNLRFSLGCLTLAAALGGCQQTDPTFHSHLHKETKTLVPATTDGRRAEVMALIDQATRATSDDTRALAALATADRASADIANTVKAIDSARQIVVQNLRNLDTTGYKAMTAKIVDGNRVVASRNMEQGSLENTGRSLDVGIQGAGFFKVQTAHSVGGGIGFTRNGNFFVNHDGELVLGVGDGYKLIPPILVPANTSDIAIAMDGGIEVIIGGQTTKQVVGTLQVFTFMNPGGLESHGSIYTETKASGSATENTPGELGSGQLLQGFLEASNVDILRERLRLHFLNDWRKTLIESAGLR